MYFRVIDAQTGGGTRGNGSSSPVGCDVNLENRIKRHVPIII